MIKIVLLVLTFTLLLSLIPLTTSASNNMGVTVNGNPVEFAGQRPVIVDGRTLVPVRGVFEAVGFEVSWDDATQTATMSNDNFNVRITIDSPTFITNGEAHNLDVPAQLIGGRVMVPIRLPLESVGHFVRWNTGTSNVAIFSSSVTISREMDGFILEVSLPSNVAMYNTSPIVSGTHIALAYIGNTPASDVRFISINPQRPTVARHSGSNELIAGMTLRGISGNAVRIASYQINNPGTAVILLENDRTHHEIGRVEINVTPTTITQTAVGDASGVHISGPMFLSQSEIQSLMPFAIYGNRTVGTPQPDRPWTNAERDAWLSEHRELGGVNAAELTMLYELNSVRADYGLNPASFCPKLSMAARLHLQLGVLGHGDPVYGGPEMRALAISPNMPGFISENVGGSIGAYLLSPGHRELVLNPRLIFVGFGSFSSNAIGPAGTMKAILSPLPDVL